jgi:hypothetical protein
MDEHVRRICCSGRTRTSIIIRLEGHPLFIGIISWLSTTHTDSDSKMLLATIERLTRFIFFDIGRNLESIPKSFAPLEDL